MTRRSEILPWVPRVLGVVVALHLALFSLHALDEGFRAFLIHQTPAILVLSVVAVAWRHEWVGSAVFSVLSLVYAVEVLPRIDWILVISGPMLAVGILYGWSWVRREKLVAGPESG